MTLIHDLTQVMHNDDDATEDLDENGVPDEAEEVGDAIWNHNQMLYALFTHYASLNGSLDALTLNSWTAMVNDCGMIQPGSKHCKARDFDLIFQEVDNMGKHEATTRRGGHAKMPAFLRQKTMLHVDHSLDSMHALSVVEFLVALVRIAINMFILSGALDDVSEATDQLLGVVIQSRLGALVTSEPDLFRDAYCYVEPVCWVLKRNEAALREVYDWICALDCKNPREPPKHIEIRPWIRALRAFEVMNFDLSERDCLRCYSWSRMAVRDYKTKRGAYEASHLPFEGFLEALCRTAAQKALPTDEEIAEIGAESAAAFLEQLYTQGEAKYKQFLNQRKLPWCGEVPTVGFETRVKHTISIFVAAHQKLRKHNRNM